MDRFGGVSRVLLSAALALVAAATTVREGAPGEYAVPLVWLLAMQLWFEDDRRPWRPVALLTVVASLQMLTSYYLSYFLLLSVAACLVVWLPARRPPVRSFVRLVAPLTLAAGVTAILALPYLEASSTGVVRLRGHAASSATLGQAWQSLKPIVRFTTDDAGGWNGAYRIPIVLLLLGLVTLIPIGRPHRALPRAAAGTRLREGPLIAGLWMVSLVGFALSLGRELRVGGLTLPLPAALLAAVVPGFANMRVPLRWQILIGVAVPILAGIGFARLRRWLSVRLAAGGPSGRPPRWAGPAAAALAVAAGATLLPPPIPTAPAMPRVAGAAQAYRELARMPDGPVVEIPWPLQPNVDGWYSSEYELASAIHWKPILNGYTAYTPRTYDFLRRMAAGLPRGDSLDRLVRLAALRWIVVHLDLLSPAERDAWHMAPTQGRLVSAYTDEHTAIFEIPPSPESGVWMPALLATAPRRQTFAGLPRTRIELSAGSGRLQATIPSRMELTDGDWLKTAVMVRVTNRSKQPWPGLDIDPEGLVAVHYRIERPDGTVATEGVSPIDADIAPGTTLDLWAAIEGRLDPGHYRLRLGLVQRFGSSVQPLAIEQVVGEVQLEPAR